LKPNRNTRDKNLKVKSHKQPEKQLVVTGFTLVFGQNDFQPKKQPSVSMGDVIRYNGERYLILAVGFRKLKEGDITVGYGPHNTRKRQ
jgi:hypothetical protein